MITSKMDMEFSLSILKLDVGKKLCLSHYFSSFSFMFIFIVGDSKSYILYSDRIPIYIFSKVSNVISIFSIRFKSNELNSDNDDVDGKRHLHLNSDKFADTACPNDGR